MSNFTNTTPPVRIRPRPLPAVLPHTEVAGVLNAVRTSSANTSVCLALEFQILTAARPGEVLGARWNEMNLEAETWTVPAERMKNRLEHRKPVSKQALVVLDKARELVSGEGLVFPGVGGRTLSSSAVSRLVLKLGFGVTPHSFRASFRGWCADTAVPTPVAEACLRSVLSDPVEMTLCRNDLLPYWRKVMEDWGAYVCGHLSSG